MAFPAPISTPNSTPASLAGPQRLKLRDLVALLKATYADTIGAEFMHISDAEQRRWVHEQLERAGGKFGLSAEEKKRVLEKLTQADGLERYLHTKYVGQKRFSLEGGDSLIPLLDELVNRGGADGMNDMVLGMAHRGRLNVLVNILGKAPQKLFAEFDGKFDHPDDPAHSGDVKYHLGFSANVKTPGRTVHLALAFNPSHLEIVDPVVAGSVRARQVHRRDETREHVVPVLIHGDASIAGQGVVMELFNMSQARGFCVGGTIHVVINNQVGFTISNPHDARSTLYCTDVAKMVNAPVFHVNGDDPEAVLFVARLAFDFRQKFKRDVVIDLVCYRRHGHNEADEPAATQPLMYQVIRARPTARELYAQEARRRRRDRRSRRAGAGRRLSQEARGRHADREPRSRFQGRVRGRLVEASAREARRTGQDRRRRRTSSPSSTARSSCCRPASPRIRASPRSTTTARRWPPAQQPMDWGFAENLAYATLIDDGYDLRLVGQDSGRGTFFHRHAVIHDQKSGGDYVPLTTVRDSANVAIIDSLLSEEAVMAFEYGYSTAEPRTLNLWEGQFGDFANGAQVVIDQFISSGEAKWDRLSGLTLLLPHGYEGQGPGAQLGAPRTLSAALRAGKHAGLRADDAGADVPHAAPADAAQRAQAADRDDAEVAAAPQAGGVDARRSRRRRFPAGDSGHDREESEEGRAASCCARARSTTISSRMPRKRKIDDVAIVRVEQLYPFPRKEVVGRARALRGREGSRLVPGRTDEPGRVVSDHASPAAPASRRSSR